MDKQDLAEETDDYFDARLGPADPFLLFVLLTGAAVAFASLVWTVLERTGSL